MSRDHDAGWERDKGTLFQSVLLVLLVLFVGFLVGAEVVFLLLLLSVSLLLGFVVVVL